jgi:hypothetical protein
VKDLLNKLIAEAPAENKGAFEAQIQFRMGPPMPGAIRKGPVDGVYQMTVAGIVDKKPVAMNLYFTPDDVVYVMTKVEEARVVAPPGAGRILTPVA